MFIYTKEILADAIDFPPNFYLQSKKLAQSVVFLQNMQYIRINMTNRAYGKLIRNKMNQKTQRLATIRKIIRSELVGSQEELIARLTESGINITQSTLSRDLKFMNVAKVPHKNKGYIYVLPNSVQHEVNVSSNISDNITSLTFSGNLGVLKTKSGYASAISVPIDNLNCPYILSTIAGDNTVLIIMREDASRSQVVDALMRIFPMLGNVL